MDINIDQLTTKAIEAVTTHGTQLAISLIVLFVGLKVINLIIKGMTKWFDKADYDRSLEIFMLSLTGMGLKAFLFITVAGIAGFPTTSLIALIGAAGLAIGMALSGTLQNFAGGVLLLMLKPFKVGDFIETQGHSGSVTAIHIFNTVINTGDNKRIILPNGPVATGAITNFSAEKTRRIEFIFGIGYDDDIDQAKDILKKLIEADSRIHTDPAPMIAVKELGDNAVNIVVRVWSDASDYWAIYFDMTENVKKTFDKEGVSFPYPQTDVHLHKVSA